MDLATCLIIGTVVTGCQPVQKPSPSEAVAILTASVAPYVYVEKGDGPQTFVIPYSGPYDPPQAPVQPLAAPWSSVSYSGFYGYPGYYGYQGNYGSLYGYAGRSRGDRHVGHAQHREVPPPTAHRASPTPAQVIGPASAGVRRSRPR